MKTTRPWVPCVAMVMLVGLLITAFFARDNGPAAISIAPDPVMPGQEITVRFAEPEVADAELTFERDGTAHSLRDNQWNEVPDGVGWQLFFTSGTSRTSLELRLPPEVEPGSYSVCATTLGGSDANPASAANVLDDLKRLCTQLEVDTQ